MRLILLGSPLYSDDAASSVANDVDGTKKGVGVKKCDEVERLGGGGDRRVGLTNDAAIVLCSRLRDRLDQNLVQVGRE